MEEYYFYTEGLTVGYHPVIDSTYALADAPAAFRS